MRPYSVGRDTEGFRWHLTTHHRQERSSNRQQVTRSTRGPRPGAHPGPQTPASSSSPFRLAEPARTTRWPIPAYAGTTRVVRTHRRAPNPGSGCCCSEPTARRTNNLRGSSRHRVRRRPSVESGRAAWKQCRLSGYPITSADTIRRASHWQVRVSTGEREQPRTTRNYFGIVIGGTRRGSETSRIKSQNPPAQNGGLGEF